MKASSDNRRLVVHTDGAARGNPGPAGIGAAIFDSSGNLVDSLAKAIGQATNNRAEYLAMIEGLQAALRLGADEVIVRSDSELIVRQLTGRYAVKSADLRPLFEAATNLLRRFRRYQILHVPREQNRTADALANKAIDEGNCVTF
ncbi:MAG: ribonuclease HI family protein [Chloroflexi bacterium]|nr:ribonuclease HI family protein [Chloroflexota bacterium]